MDQEQDAWRQAVTAAGGLQAYFEDVLFSMKPEEFQEMEANLLDEPDSSLNFSNSTEYQYYQDISDGEVDELLLLEQVLDTEIFVPIEYQDEDASAVPLPPPTEEEFLKIREKLTASQQKTKAARLATRRTQILHGMDLEIQRQEQTLLLGDIERDKEVEELPKVEEIEEVEGELYEYEYLDNEGEEEGEREEEKDKEEGDRKEEEEYEEAFFSDNEEEDVEEDRVVKKPRLD